MAAAPRFARALDGADPHLIPSSWLEAQPIAANPGVVTIKGNLPYIVFYNADNVVHTLTGAGRATSDVAPAAGIPFALSPGVVYPLPTAIFGAVADAQANGKVYFFYSDVAIPGTALGPGTATLNVQGIGPNGSILTEPVLGSGPFPITANAAVMASSDFTPGSGEVWALDAFYQPASAALAGDLIVWASNAKLVKLADVAFTATAQIVNLAGLQVSGPNGNLVSFNVTAAGGAARLCVAGRRVA